MKLAFHLAYKNLVGAGLRTWLNVGVLSFAFVIIIFFNALMDGWNQQARKDSIDWEFGAGQLLNENYDPLDPFSLQDGHAVLAQSERENLEAILIQQASVYPQGRMISISLKGINPNQKTLKLPTQKLLESNADIPVIIGKNMASNLGLKEGDKLLMRWRDKNGTFDAANISIVEVFDTDVPTVDNGQVWMGLDKLQELTGLIDHATLFVANENYVPKEIAGWDYQDKEELLHNLTEIIQTKKISSSIMYLLLLAIALLAVFDTQVLSIFRRQKEIGTYIALGMTRTRVLAMFTLEGTMYSFLAMLVGCIYGIPFFILMASYGIPIPSASQGVGVALGDKIYPVFGIGLILGTIALMVVSATIVSYLPARKIAKMNPVDALKGKLQ